jgi:hypothetical protein
MGVALGSWLRLRVWTGRVGGEPPRICLPAPRLKRKAQARGPDRPNESAGLRRVAWRLHLSFPGLLVPH